MTDPTSSPSPDSSDAPWHRGNTGKRTRRNGRDKRRISRLALTSALCFWAAILALALPGAAHADANSLASYGATASGWAIQPYVLNDAFLNVPAADQAAPYVFVSMDNTPGAEAKAAYFFPGTAGNAVLNTQNIAAKVPNGIDVRYPSNSTSTNESVGAVNDQNGDFVSAATQSGKASEGYAQAQAAEAAYQFAPSVLSSQPPSPPPLPVVTPPAIPSTIPSGSATPTPTSGGSGGSGGGSGGSATPTPTSTPTPKPTCTPIPLIGGCSPTGSTGGSQANTSGPATSSDAYTLPTPPAKLPDPVEQALSTTLTTLEAQNPALKQLIQGAQTPLPNSSLPYAGGDIASVALSQATDSGVGIAVDTHAAKLQLFQGLISFASVDTELQAVAPASTTQQGSGKITTTITGATIGGIPVTITQSGVQVASQSQSAQQVQQETQQLNAALKQAGIQISLIPSTTKTDMGFWQGAGGGLEVTAQLNPGSNLPSPANGVPATHADFTIAEVTGSGYAVPGSSSSSSSAGGSGFGCSFCGGFSFPGTPGTPGSQSGGSTLISKVPGGELLAILFVIEGLSTGAVAASARYGKMLAAVAKPVIEEETR